jgi:hypothetical protein
VPAIEQIHADLEKDQDGSRPVQKAREVVKAQTPASVAPTGPGAMDHRGAA